MNAARMLAFALLATSTGIAAAPPADEQWYVMVAQGEIPVGQASRTIARDGTGSIMVETRELRLTELHHGPLRITERTTIRTDGAGHVVSIGETSTQGRAWSKTDARIDGARAEIEHRTRTGRQVVSLALPPGLRFDGGEALLAGWDPVAGPRLEFPNFSIGAPAVERVVIEPASRAGRDAEGRIAVMRWRYDGRALRGVSRLTLDRDNRIVAVTQPMFGKSITLKPVDRATALRPYSPHKVDLDLMIASPFRISAEAARGHIRYRFGFRDGMRFELPRTGAQRFTSDRDTVTIDICGTCGPAISGDMTPDDALKPTTWLQSDSPALTRIAAPVAKLELSGERKMAMLAKLARDRLPKVDYTGHYSALDALKRGAGDCTEDAVLLAALGRAAGIPTLVANGIVYNRQRYHGIGQAFVPHSWTLAWIDGRWRDFDMTTGNFDSTHIALTVGDGDPRSIFVASQLAGLLVWRDMAEVRPRPPAGR